MAQGSKNWIWISGAAALVVVVGVFLFAHKGNSFKLLTGLVTTGSLNATVSATGTVNPVTTVQIGSQVSGTVSKLNADYNSEVKAGQVLAVLDPAIYTAQLSQAVATLEKAKVTTDDALRSYNRAKELLAENFIAAADRDAAETAYRGAVASQKQSEAAVNLARVNLDHCTITSPISGIVISRSVDVGQTVAASLQAPQLFLIANDLTRMQVETAIDEADVGKVKTGQPVTFTVDAFPDDVFRGLVREVRSEPITVQNVVTYTTVIDVFNPEGKLKPGMTANVSILVARRESVLKVPNAALRFKPSDDVAKKLGIKLPDATRGGANGANGGGGGQASTSAGSEGRLVSAGGGADSTTGRRGGKSWGGQGDSAGSPGAGMQNGWRARHGGAADSAAGPAGSRARGGAGGRGNGGAGGQMAGGAGGGGFGGGNRRAKPPAKVYVMTAPNKVEAVTLKVGLSDGSYTEVLDGELHDGQQVVTGVLTQGVVAQSAPPGMGSPFGGGGGGGARGGR